MDRVCPFSSKKDNIKMENKIIGKIERKKGLTYRINKNGDIIEESYNIFKDPYTLVTLAIIILGLLFYVQMKQSATNTSNFDKICVLYSNIRADYILNNPDKEINLKNVLNYYDTNKKELDIKFNLSNGLE